MKPCFPTIRSHGFRSGKYQIIWRAPKRTKDTPKGENVFGLCQFHEKKLWMYISTDPMELLDTVLDETTHANHPDLDNDAVREGVVATIELLKRMGMRITFDGG